MGGIRNSDSSFRTVFENSPAIMLLIDPVTHEIVAANKAAAEFYGWDIPQLESMLISQINTLSGKKLKAEMSKARTGIHTPPFHFRHRLASGELRDVEVYSGKVVIKGRDYLHSVIHDVTLQVKAGGLLRRSKQKLEEKNRELRKILKEKSELDERMQFALSSSKTGAWALNLNDLSATRTIELDRIFGYEEPIPHWGFEIFMEHVLEKERKRVDSSFREAVDNHREWDFECQIRRKDGYIRWIWTRGSHLPASNNEPPRMAGIVQDITARKERELRDKERFALINMAGEMARVGGWTVNLNENTVLWSNVVADIHEMPHGYSPTVEEGIKYYAPEWREKITAAFNLCATEGVPYDEEMEIITSTGKRVWVRAMGKAIRDEQGVIIVVQGALQDISGSKTAEEALLHSHSLMKYIIEHNQSAVAVHDKELNYLFVSQRYLDDYRVKERDIIGKHHYEVFPDIPKRWRRVHQKALKGIVSRGDRDLFHREDGTTDWTRWECRPWHEADGSIGGIIIYTEVINDQVKREGEIKLLNHRLGTLNSSIQDLASTETTEELQRLLTRSARKLLGADGATLVLKEKEYCHYVEEDSIAPLWRTEKFPVSSCISGWVMENRQHVVIEDILEDERIPADLYKTTFVKSMAMVPINTGSPIGAIGNYWKEHHIPSDTEMELLQTLADTAARTFERINLYPELEDRVKQRTRELHDLNRELETFTYSVSHDLKAPLRGIDGYSRLLQEEYAEKLEEEGVSYIETIRSSTQRMNNLIDDLLAYSRLERTPLRPDKIALKPFIKEILSVFREELKRRGVSVKYDIPEVDIYGDKTALSLVLRNLIENAIKFSGGIARPEIVIGLREDAGRWVVTVQDNGIGFNMKYHDRIFEIFQRLHRAEEYAGTGIGLAIVTKAMKRMGGSVRAESVPGEGSTFFIEIPKEFNYDRGRE